MTRCHTASAWFVLVGLLVGCSQPSPDPDDATPTAPSPPTLTAAETIEGGPPADVGQPSACDSLSGNTIGEISSDQLVELSGLAASTRYPDTLWAHNDSGHSTSVFAFDSKGTDLTRLDLPEAANSLDIEDMALTDGSIYLADIGDNQANRQQVQILRFDEPSPSEPTGSTVSDFDIVTLSYPDHPHDAEAFLVDTDGSLVIITKEADPDDIARVEPSQIFVADTPVQWGSSQQLRHAGSLDLSLAYQANPDARQSLFTFGNLKRLVTGADLRHDGKVVAVRNYGNVWLFERPSNASIADALQTTPCEAPVPSEAQGEAVAFLYPDSNDVVTVSEGSNPPINVSQTG